jgi:hypothetical protein
MMRTEIRTQKSELRILHFLLSTFCVLSLLGVLCGESFAQQPRQLAVPRGIVLHTTDGRTPTLLRSSSGRMMIVTPPARAIVLKPFPLHPSFIYQGGAGLGPNAINSLTYFDGALCGTNQILEDQGASWACIATPAGGATVWSGIGNPTGNQALTMAAFTSTWTWNATTGLGVNLVTLTDTLNNTGTGYLFSLNTASGSAAKPWRICYQGTTNCITFDAGTMVATGTAVINASQLLGATWASPAAIGTGTPAAGTFAALTATGVFTPSAGTLSAPSIQMDTQTGFYRFAASQIGVSAGNSLAARFSSAGISLASDDSVFWCSDTACAVAIDLGMKRSAAGVARVTDGAAGRGALEMLRSNITLGTITTDIQAANITVTLNAAGVDFKVRKATVTNTASGANTCLDSWTVGATEVYCLRVTGQMDLGGTSTGTIASIVAAAMSTAGAGRSSLGFNTGHVFSVSENNGAVTPVIIGTRANFPNAAPVRGSIFCANITPAWVALPIGAANRVLFSDGADCSWAQVPLATAVSGTLPVGNGGTGLTGGTSGGVPFYSAAATLASSAALGANLPVFGGGAGVAPFTGTRTGNTTQLASWTGATTADRCVNTDASGNLRVTGADCGTGSSGNNNALFTATADATVSNSAAEATIVGTGVGSKTTTANYFAAGTSLLVRSSGYLSTPAVPDAITIRIKAGTTAVGSATFTLPLNLANQVFTVEALVTCRTAGATGTFMLNDIVLTTNSTLTATISAKALNTATVTLDTTGTLAWDVTAQWGAAQAGETIIGTNFVMFTPGTGIADPGANGILARTALNTVSARTLVAGAGLGGSNLDGVSGNPSFNTASSETDFLASGALTCGAATQGKAQVHTTPLQYCDNAATPALQYAAYASSTGDALTGDTATAFFATGTLEDARLSTNVALYNNGSKTWGAGAGFNWTFDAGATDPVFEFTSGNVKFSGATTYTFEGGATDPVLTPSNSILNLSTGTLQQGGTAVLLDAAGNGLLARTAAQAVTARTLASESLSFFTWTNGDGVAGNPTPAFAAKARTGNIDVTIDAPTTADTNKVQWYLPSASTITRVVCSVGAATSVTIQLDERAEATPNTAGTNVMTASLVCDTTNGGITTSFTNATIAARVPLNLQVTAVSGTPGSMRVHIEYTID